MSTKTITAANVVKHVTLGKKLITEDLHFEAFDHFKKSIGINTDYAFDILTYLYKLQCHKKTHINIQLIIAKIYIEINMISEAFDAFEEALEQDPHHEPIYEALATLISKKQLRSKIKQCFEAALKKDIFYPPIITTLPNIYLEEKNYSKAIALYNNLIKQNPKEFNYYKVLSELHFRKRDYDAASETLEQLIMIAPFKSEELIQPIEQIIQKIPRQPIIRTLYANVLFRAFKPIEGCEEIKTLIKYHPNKKHDAITLLKEQNEAFPQTPDILYLLSELMIESELYTDSLHYIQTIIDISAEHCDSCLLLMQKIIQFYPKHVLALEIIGTIYFQQENYLQAFHYFDQCIEECDIPNELSFIDFIKQVYENNHEPSQNYAKLLMAKIYSKSNEHELAMSLIKELDQTAESIEANILKIKLLNKSNNYFESLSIIKTLLSKHPFHWNIHNINQRTFSEYTEHKIKEAKSESQTTDSQLTESSHLLINGALEKAIQTLQKIPPNSSHFEIAQRMIARCFFERSRFDLSDQILSRIIKNSQNQLVIKECHYWTALSHILLSNDEEALQSFEIISTMDQNYLNTQPFINRLRKNKFLNHNGLVIVNNQRFMSENKEFQLALRKNHFGPQNKKRHQFEVIGFAQSYNDEGCKQIIKQQLRAGRESLELAVQMDPKFHISYLNLAMIDLMENKTSEALERISQAEAITTKCPYLFYIKGQCFIQKNNIESAIRTIQQAINLFANEGIFYLTLGDLFYQQHQIELASTYWKKSIQSNEYSHWEQQRYRSKHFNKISIGYWISPELLSLR